MTDREKKIMDACPFMPTSAYAEGFVTGAIWADNNPNGFLNYQPHNSITKKEFVEMLNEFPDDAIVCVECCNPRATIYCEKDNTIRID